MLSVGCEEVASHLSVVRRHEDKPFVGRQDLATDNLWHSPCIGIELLWYHPDSMSGCASNPQQPWCPRVCVSIRTLALAAAIVYKILYYYCTIETSSGR